MNPMLTRMLPSSSAWLRPLVGAPRPLPDIVLDESVPYRSECFAEDLQAASDAALADLFPMLRTQRRATAGR
jgi:hypothetical protein